MKSRTYKLNSTEAGRFISGMASGKEAVLINLFLFVLTERGKYEIFDDDYGIEYSDLYGERCEYAVSMIKRRITEGVRKYFGDELILLGYDHTLTDGTLDMIFHFTDNGIEE